MKKTLVALVLIMAICLCGACAPNDDNTAQLQEQITQMQQLIDSLSEQMEDMSSANNIEDIQSLKDKLKEQQEKIDLYKAQLRNLTGMPIKFTADAPVYGNKENEETIIEYNSFDDNPYLCFMDYYEKNKPIEDDLIYYVFRPDDYEDEAKILIGRNYTNRHYLLVKQDDKFLIEEALIIYDEVFDDGMWDEELDGYDPSWKESFQLVFYMDPVEKNTEKIYDYHFFDLEFGQTDSGRTYFNMYVNKGRYNCIGTCYYDTNCYMSYTGFKEYVYNRLVTI